MTTVTELDRLERRPVSGETMVTVHPLVLLSVVDHYNRACKDTNNRAVGVLLGSWKGNTLDVANSFAVPFEEDEKSADVWFLDHDYLKNMFAMFRKVNARERIVGWYHTGPKLRPSDVRIHELMQRFVQHPILVVIDAYPKDLGLPTKAYVLVEEVHDDGTPTSKTFEHVASEVGAEEVEEVGVEHLLRDIQHLGISGSLTHRVQSKLTSLKGLQSHLAEIHEYLDMVAKGKRPINHAILYVLQDIFNLLPNLNSTDLASAMSSATSDQMLVVYLATLLRASIALHNLINNKLENQEAERKMDGDDKDDTKKSEKDKEKEKKDEKDKDKKDEKAKAGADGDARKGAKPAKK